MLVDGHPWVIRGLTYKPTAVGETPDVGPLPDWTTADRNHDGQLDAFEVFVDANRNNRRDADEPLVSDFELIRRMRHHDALHGVPVMMLTGSPRAFNLAESLECELAVLLRKPIGGDTLVEAMSRTLGARLPTRPQAELDAEELHRAETHHAPSADVDPRKAEAELQSLILTQQTAVRLVNTVYVWGHIPLIIVIAIWLFTFHRQRYPLFRNAFLISGAIGLLLFWLLPTAPPRYLQYWGFVDTAVHSGSYYIFQSPSFVNEYAAMPSLHFGWSLLCATAVFANVRSRWRYLAYLLPIATLGGVVLTANHYFLDVFAGGCVALVALFLASQIRIRAPRYKPFTVLT